MRVQAVTHQQMKKHLKRVKMNCKMTINNLFKAIIIKDWEELEIDPFIESGQKRFK